MAYSARFDEALLYASDLHREQVRKGGDEIPYITHLLGVASIVGENGGTEEEVIAALLHDAIEDQGGAAAEEEIRRRFGEEVVEIVRGCSDTDVVPKPPWRERKETYVAHVVGASDSVRFVSAADKLHNARAILTDLRRLEDRLWERFTGSKDDTLWYYRALVEAYEKTSTKPAVVEELHRTLDEIGRLAAEGGRFDQGGR